MTFPTLDDVFASCAIGTLSLKVTRAVPRAFHAKGLPGVPTVTKLSTRHVVGVTAVARTNSLAPRIELVEVTPAQVLGVATLGTLKTMGARHFRSLWRPASLTTSQGFTNRHGLYDVPSNLHANASSDDVSTISASTWIEHFPAIIQNQVDLIGSPVNINNYRDTKRDLAVGTTIRQHRAPLLKAMLLAANTAYDLPQAIRYADQEYNRFRNKFARKLIELANHGTLAIDNDPDVWVMTTLTAIKRDKSNQFPFALNSIGGGQHFIPPTPTCLGVLPAADPALIIDDTYSIPVTMILGHDGSLTPAFGDWRDAIMLALERLIYKNLPPQFQTEVRPSFDLAHWVGGRFTDPVNGYTRDEVTTMLTPMFELWASQNRFDYRTNKGFDQTNPFTWNFNGVRDTAGNPLPGNWRAIYRWYYNTDSPHRRPWEMLGFVGEPPWWQTYYGTAPFTSANAALWTDLATGTIRNGPRAGIDKDYIRPGLSNVMPVDNAGNLLDPIAAGIVPANIGFETASRSWLAGDQGPVENLWMTSPSYRFALAVIGFLLKPARFVEQCWDPSNIGYVGEQWVEFATNTRPVSSHQVVHGETRDGVIMRVVGISQWIADYLWAAGHNSNAFGATVRGLDVRLMHRMAGFVSSDDMKVIADNFSLLPAEDVNIVLYTSPMTRTEVYSGVILEWTGRSWRVIGYDARNPYFTIIPPDLNGPKGVISLATTAEPVIVEWHANTYYTIDILAIHYNSVWQCVRSHTSSPQFEQNFWRPRSDINPAMIHAPRVITYARGLNVTQRVTYGAEFTDYQSVSDLLLGWQRWLESRGWIFDDLDPQSGEIRNWSLSVKEFLSWAQVQWAPGNFIALSPGQQNLKFSTATGTILNVESSIDGFFGLIDRTGRPIGQRDAILNRLDGDLAITAKDADIFCARFGLADTEHALVFSNKTIFDDAIYLPLFDMRQTRLRLICKRSRNWTGRLDAPGFIIAGNRLLSNFEKATEDVRLMFDIEHPDRGDLRTYARHVIGFQKRDYLENLFLSDIEQFEFYQGMIQQKGAPGVFNKLIRSNRVSNTTDLKFLEEWAIRIGEYGRPIDPFTIFQLHQIDVRNDPQIISFAPEVAPLDWIVFEDVDVRWVDKPPTNFFTMRNDLAPANVPTAGPVRLTEVTATAFYLDDLSAMCDALVATGVTPFPTGSRTWVYERNDGTFTVLRSFDTGVQPNTILTVISSVEDLSITTTRLVLQQPITLTDNDVGNLLVIDGLSLSVPELRGVATITAVDPLTSSVDINLVSVIGSDFTTSIFAPPYVRVLREVRFANRSALATSGYAFVTGDLVWIDNDPVGWSVLQRTGSAWTTVRREPFRTDATTISETVIYHAGTTIIDQQMIIDEPVVKDVVVIDPLVGLIAGIADREIDFRSEYDPARYTSSKFNIDLSANSWGARQVGRVWWHLATTKFLNPFTDTLGVTKDRDIAELSYRCTNWSHIAPGTSIDIYEWVASLVSPLHYDGPGTVFNRDAPTWSEHQTRDQLGRSVTMFYFWVTGLTTTPSVPFRHIDTSTIALAIQNPAGLDLPWMAPIAPNVMIVSGVTQFLDDHTTVMKVRITVDPESPGRHDDWKLMRPTDATSLPSPLLWQKIRDSLATFDSELCLVPDPMLSAMRATGIRASQGMFALHGPDGPRSGLLAARRSFVQIVNLILGRAPMARDREGLIHTLYRSTSRAENLAWAQPDESYIFEPPPRNEWTIEVFSIEQRNFLLGRSDFAAALSTGQKIRVLINGIANPFPYRQWSIWEFDPDAANTLILHNPSVDSDNLLMANADAVFKLATSWEYEVADIAARDQLLGLVPGDRVLVMHDVAGFWSIWQYQPTGFVLWRAQTYRTDDFISKIDWYAEGHSANNPPIVTYPFVKDRNAIEGASPSNQFVKINDGGDPLHPTHRWIWTQFDAITKQWTTVAMQQGTVALSEHFYDPTRSIYSVRKPYGMHPYGTGNYGIAQILSDISNRDGSWELYVLADALRYGGLLNDGEINEIFFSILNFCHQQDNVDWAFPTSFMSIVGYNVPLKQTPVLLTDQTDSLLSYINEVKPYHVKIRAFATQYNPDIDPVNTHNSIEEPAFDITLLFDRYGFKLGWDIEPFDSVHWDEGELNSDIYVHTTVNQTLEVDGPTMQVDDIRFLTGTYDAYQRFQVVSDSHPLSLGVIGFTNSYQIVNAVPDAVDISSILAIGGETTDADTGQRIPVPVADHDPAFRSFTVGVSGQLTLKSYAYGIGDYGFPLGFSVADATAGNVIEATIAMPDAALRCLGSSSDSNLSLLFDLDYRPVFANYVLSDPAYVSSGSANVLQLTDTTNIAVGQPVTGPNITKGTIVTDVTSTSIRLSQPILNDILSNVAIAVGLPVLIGSYPLKATLDRDVPTYQGSVVTDRAVSGWNPILDVTARGVAGALLNGVSSLKPSEVRYDLSINPPLASRPGGFDLRSPYHTPKHPEERIPFNADDALHMTVTALPLAGEPPQLVRVFDVTSLSGQNATLSFEMLSHSNLAVMVFRNGVRAVLGTNFTVDYFARTVSPINNWKSDLPPSPKTTVAIHVFGFGGKSAISDAFYLTVASPITIDAVTTTDAVMLVVDGVSVASSEYSVAGNVITNSAVGVKDTAIVIYEGGKTTATTINPIQNLLATGLFNQLTLQPRDTDTFPEHAGTIVEINGRRQTPPVTYYGYFTSNIPWMYLSPGYMSPRINLKIYMSGIEYTETVPVTNSIDSASEYPFKLHLAPSEVPSTHVAGQFVIFNDFLVALDKDFHGTVTVVMSSIVPDYTIDTDGVMTFDTPPIGQIAITTFNNAVTMGIKTLVYSAPDATASLTAPPAPTVGQLWDTNSGLKRWNGSDWASVLKNYFVPKPVSQDYTLVSMKGRTLNPDLEYKIRDQTIGWDTMAMDDLPYDFIWSQCLLDILIPIDGTIVATMFTSPVASELQQWMINTYGPATTRMPPLMDYSDLMVPLMGLPRHGNALMPLYDANFEYVNQSMYLAGKLMNDLHATDTTITIDLFLRDLAVKLQPLRPLMIPDQMPGVIWIGAERIEYFGLVRNGDMVVLSQLRRGTRGTSITEQRQVIKAIGNAAPHTYTLNGIGLVEVMVNDLPHACNISIIGNDTAVTVSADVDDFITVAMTTGYTYRQGTVIYNGSSIGEPEFLPA